MRKTLQALIMVSLSVMPTAQKAIAKPNPVVQSIDVALYEPLLELTKVLIGGKSYGNNRQVEKVEGRYPRTIYTDDCKIITSEYGNHKFRTEIQTEMKSGVEKPIYALIEADGYRMVLLSGTSLNSFGLVGELALRRASETNSSAPLLIPTDTPGVHDFTKYTLELLSVLAETGTLRTDLLNDMGNSKEKFASKFK